MLNKKELEKCKFICNVDKESIKKFNKLSQEQQDKAWFYVALVPAGFELGDPDGYDEFDGGGIPFEMPARKTPEEAAALAEGCIYNEVHFDLVLYVNFPEGRGIDTLHIGYICGIM